MDRLPKNENSNFSDGFEMARAVRIRDTDVINLNPSVEERLGMLPLPLERETAVGAVNFAEPPVTTSISQTMQFELSELEHLNAVASTVSSSTINAGAISFAGPSIVSSTSHTLQFELSELEHLNVMLNRVNPQPIEQEQHSEEEQFRVLLLQGSTLRLPVNFSSNFNTTLHQSATLVCGANQYVAEGDITIIRQLTTSESGAMRLELSTGEIELIGDMSLGDFGG